MLAAGGGDLDLEVGVLFLPGGGEFVDAAAYRHGHDLLADQILHLVDAAILAAVDLDQAGADRALRNEELLFASGRPVVAAGRDVVFSGRKAGLLSDVGSTLHLKFVLGQLGVDRLQDVGFVTLRLDADGTPRERLGFGSRGDLDGAHVLGMR